MDVGLLDGCTIKRFIESVNGNYTKIWGLEPDPENFLESEKLIRRNGYRDVYLIKCGAWDEKGKFSFFSGVGGVCRVDEGGNSTADLDKIDNIVGDDNISLITMDIEGSELRALHGAADTIRKQKPTLAICVYHKPEDLITIPQYIKSLNSDYKFYLRHNGCFELDELVLYVIP